MLFEKWPFCRTMIASMASFGIYITCSRHRIFWLDVFTILLSPRVCVAVTANSFRLFQISLHYDRIVPIEYTQHTAHTFNVLCDLFADAK